MHFRSEGDVTVYLIECSGINEVKFVNQKQLVTTRIDNDDRELKWNQKCKLRACNENVICVIEEITIRFKDYRTPPVTSSFTNSIKYLNCK